MGRFSIETSGSFAWLRDSVTGGVKSCLDHANADEIRRLLDQAFPVEQPQRAHIGKWVQASEPQWVCEVCKAPLYSTSNSLGCTGSPSMQPQPTQGPPDPDEVRRALARMRDQSPRLYSFERVVCEAAEAWLRDQGEEA